METLVGRIQRSDVTIPQRFRDTRSLLRVARCELKKRKIRSDEPGLLLLRKEAAVSRDRSLATRGEPREREFNEQGALQSLRSLRVHGHDAEVTILVG